MSAFSRAPIKNTLRRAKGEWWGDIDCLIIVAIENKKWITENNRWQLKCIEPRYKHDGPALAYTTTKCCGCCSFYFSQCHRERKAIKGNNQTVKALQL